MKEVLVAWQMLRKELLRERELECLRDEVLQHRLAKEGVARQALAQLMGSKSSTLLMTTFVAWRMLQKELHREREFERLREEVLQHRLAKEGLARQALAQLLGSNAAALLK